jgi:phospholipid/cholesterol/gamma-HCH transport system substrate-binding protein
MPTASTTSCKSVADLSQHGASPFPAVLDSTLASAENLITSIDPQKIDRILANVDKVTSDVASASGDITKTLESFSQAAGSLERLAADAGESLDKVDRIIASVDPAKVGESMDNIALASADARKALADARGVVETFSARKEDYDLIITDVKQLTGRLNAASTRVDGVLAKLDNFLGEGDASSLIADAEATLKSFRDVADSLNARVGPIADNLQRFSGSGLRNVEALVNDARRSIQRIERSISTIEQDPQRLIFGGDTVKQYDGRNRR